MTFADPSSIAAAAQGDPEALRNWLESGPTEAQMLFDAASSQLKQTIGGNVYLRGIVEVSNACQKDCLYCGVRRSNRLITRYEIPFDEICESIETGYALGLRSFLLQSGELVGDAHISLVERVLRWSRSKWGEEVRSVVSLGELPKDVYQQLHDAGGDRYLLRIETSNPDLYRRLHPHDNQHRWEDRLQALHHLRETGWQVGTGVLIGVPWQTVDDLVGDLLFMRDFDIDMCGMGPYIEHEDTPLWEHRDQVPSRQERVELVLRMIALMRLILPDINMSATTALQTIDPEGLEKGMAAGANVFMPNLTPWKYREDYNLYQGKVRVPDTLDVILSRMMARCEAIGRPVVLGTSGDPLRFAKRSAAAR